MPLPALYKTAAQVTLADKSYTGTGIGVITPGKGTNPCPDDQTRNNPHTALRSPTQRANTILKHLKAPQHATLNPQTTTHTTTTTPIITNPNKHTQRKRLTVEAFILPGMPWRNGFVDSFHNRLRDELLEDELFDDPAHASHCLRQWSIRYNTYHPHSSPGFIPPAEYTKQWHHNQKDTQTTRP